MFRVHGLPSAKASARNMVEARPFFQGPGMPARFWSCLEGCLSAERGGRGRKKKRIAVVTTSTGPEQHEYGQVSPPREARYIARKPSGWTARAARQRKKKKVPRHGFAGEPNETWRLSEARQPQKSGALA